MVASPDAKRRHSNAHCKQLSKVTQARTFILAKFICSAFSLKDYKCRKNLFEGFKKQSKIKHEFKKTTAPV